MVQFDWLPQLDNSDGPIWRRLVESIGSAIDAGTLPEGTRLPPHRDLAFRLGVGVGTVSKAYTEAERAGLVASHVGRGTFVAARASVRSLQQPLGLIDMARNLPPLAPVLARLGDTVGRLRDRSDLAALVDYTPAVGLEPVRAAGARWIREKIAVPHARAEDLIQTNGGQQALMLACSSFARPGDTILCDIATYPGNRIVATHGGWNLRGIRDDGRGMDPDDLDRIAAETGARIVILIPTLHNPTTVTLDAARRAEIARVARARNLLIIEDDICRAFGKAEAIPTFAEIAPDITLHITSLSKSLAPGLRLAFILPPADREARDRLMIAQQASLYCPSAAGALLFMQWMEDGTADLILGDVLAETARRTALAREILGDAVAELHTPHSLHVWLPMAAPHARRIADIAIKSGVEVTPPDAPFGPNDDPTGIRLCLGAEADIDRLTQALQTVRAAMDDRSVQVRGIV